MIGVVQNWSGSASSYGDRKCFNPLGTFLQKSLPREHSTNWYTPTTLVFETSVREAALFALAHDRGHAIKADGGDKPESFVNCCIWLK